jgi:Ran GTPase-activating protein (RanGAP) involved in mRNA processing and transport
LRGITWEFHPGFVGAVKAENFASFGRDRGRIFTLAPVQHVRFPWAFLGVQSLALSPLLSRLRGLNLDDAIQTTYSARALAHSRHLKGLRELYLGSCAVDAEMLAFLVQAGWPALTHLSLWENPGVAAGVRVLASWGVLGHLSSLNLSSCGLKGEALEVLAAVKLPNLIDLDLADNPLGVAGARLLAGSPLLAAVRCLDVHGCELGAEGFAALLRDVPTLLALTASTNQLAVAGAEVLAAETRQTELNYLWLMNNQLGDRGLEVLGGAPHLRRLQHLYLDHNQITEAGVRALAGSPILAALSLLSLGGNDLGDNGAVALAEAPSLAGLRHLNLERTGIGDAGALALAHSPSLSRLERLQLNGNPLSPQAIGSLRSRFGDRLVYPDT